MIFWLRFAGKSVLRRRRRTLITFVSVGVGIAMLIVLGAIMVGVNDTMIENSVALHSGNLVIEAPPVPLAKAIELTADWEARLPQLGMKQILPRYNLSAVLRYNDQVRALQLRLVDPTREGTDSPIPASLISGAWLQASPGLVIGSGIAETLGLTVGDRVTLLTDEQQFKLMISGIFRTGVQGFDQGFGYLSVSVARDLKISSSVQPQLALFTPAGTDLERLAAQVPRDKLEDLQVLPWQKQLPEVEQLVRLNAFSMQIMIMLVIAILAFGIANSLLISVMDRYRYYGILKAIGVRPREIMATVVGEALLICLAAGSLGTVLGIAVSLFWGQIGLDISHYTSYNPHFSINPVIHPRLEPVMVFLPQGLALVGSLLASIWPALVAARRSVSSSMRDL